MSIIIFSVFKKSGSGGPVELLIDLVSPYTDIISNTQICKNQQKEENWVRLTYDLTPKDEE